MKVSFDFGGGASGSVVTAWRAGRRTPPTCTVSWQETPGRPERREVVAWKGSALPAIRTSLRLCACHVAHLLPEGVDPVLRQWLRTGDPAVIDAVVTVARTLERSSRTEPARSALAVVELAATACEAEWESEWMGGSVAALADRAAPGAAQPFADHLLACALYQARAVLDEDGRLACLPGAPLEAWRRVVLCSVSADLREELMGLGWVAEPVVEVA